MSDVLVNTAQRVKRYTAGERQPDDFYATPARCTEALLRHERFPVPVWEPACGDGAIAAVLQKAGHVVVATDLVDRGFGVARRDFLMEFELLAPAIVTNPPFKLADEFTLHALRLGAEKLAIFQRTAWVEGAARLASLWRPYPPVRIWQFARRQTLWRGDDELRKDNGGAIAFAWFVWERGFSGAPSLGWIE